MKCVKKCKYTLDDMRKTSQTRGGKCISTKYDSHNMMWECADGHRWRRSPAYIRSGSWCPYCQWFFSEEKCRHIFEHLTGFFFSKNRKILHGLELDGYCEKLSIAFEYNGKQHYEFTKFFHRTIAKFREKQKIDQHKISECERLGISLIVIPYTESRTDEALVSFIRSMLPDKCIQNKNQITFRGLHRHLSVLRKLSDLAQSQQGRLLSNVYSGTHSNLEWECKKGHVWNAQPSSVKQGRWCPKCAGNTRLSLHKAHSMALSRGGKCLSKTYVNNRSKLEWECKEGHRWDATLDNIKTKSWCPFCSHRKKLTIDEMKLLAKAKGGKCLSKIYVNNRSKLEWQCQCGYIWQATPQHIKDSTWCPKCATQIIPTIADMRKIASLRCGKCLSDKYTNAHTKLQWECRKGHIWNSSPTNIKQGKWCRKCYNRECNI